MIENSAVYRISVGHSVSLLVKFLLHYRAPWGLIIVFVSITFRIELPVEGIFLPLNTLNESRGCAEWFYLHHSSRKRIKNYAR